MAFERFIRRNLRAAEENGDEVQRIDMAGLVAQSSQVFGELGDILGGRRKQKNHPHHPVKVLTDACVSNIAAVAELRREIENK